MPRDGGIGGGDVSGERGAREGTTPTGVPPRLAKTKIGKPAKATRKRGEGQRDNDTHSWHALATPPNGHEIGPAKVRRRRANTASTPTSLTPASDPIGPASDGAAGGEGQPAPDTQEPPALATSSRVDHLIVVRQLVELQKQRLFCIKETNGSVSRIEHLMVSALGTDGTDKSRKKAFAKARKFRLGAEGNGEGQNPNDTLDRPALSVFAPLIVQAAAAREQWPILRKNLERDMERLARLLPAAAYVATVRGFGFLGYAVMAAEAGIPLRDYLTISGLWKHMGLAVIDGRRQMGISGKRKDDEEARRLFHPKRRRGEVFTFLSETMFKHQWAGARLDCFVCGKPTKFDWKDDAAVCEVCETACPASDVILGHAAGPYGEVYARRIAATRPRVLATDNLDGKDPEKWTPKRCDNDARRIMSKALLRDLWRVERGLPPRGLNEP